VDAGRRSMLSLFIIRVVGLIIITAVLGIAWVLWIKADKLEEDIENESCSTGEE
jgi:hypothetical protein